MPLEHTFHGNFRLHSIDSREKGEDSQEEIHFHWQYHVKNWERRFSSCQALLKRTFQKPNYHRNLKVKHESDRRRGWLKNIQNFL